MNAPTMPVVNVKMEHDDSMGFFTEATEDLDTQQRLVEETLNERYARKHDMDYTDGQLIEAVKKHRELYDTKHKDYMKAKLKNRVWSKIARELKLKNGEEAKMLWLRLRTRHRDAIRRQQKYCKNGVSSDKVKKWKFQDQMSFLELFMTLGQREENYSDDDSQQFSTQTEESCAVYGEVDYSEERNGEALNRESTAQSGTSPVAQSDTSKVINQNDYRDFVERAIDEVEEKIVQRIGERGNVQTSNNDNPLYNFFLSMYQLTCKMPPNYQHRVRGQLFAAVSQAEEEIMNAQLLSSTNSLPRTHPNELSYSRSHAM